MSLDGNMMRQEEEDGQDWETLTLIVKAILNNSVEFYFIIVFVHVTDSWLCASRICSGSPQEVWIPLFEFCITCHQLLNHARSLQIIYCNPSLD